MPSGGSGAQSSLPGEEVGAVDVAVGVGVAGVIVHLARCAKAGLPQGQISSVHGTVAIEIGGHVVRRHNR